PNFAYPIRGVLWYQGESDYSDHKPAAQYGVHLEQLVHDLRRDLKNPELVFITCQLASFARADIDRWTAYQDVQRRHAARDPRAVLVPTVDLPLNDPVHLNIHGYRRAGRRMAMAALHLIHGQGLAPGPRLRSVHRDPADPNNRIIIAWDRPVTGGQGDLFRLRDGAGKLPVAEVVSSGATTVLTLKRALVGDAILHYGYLKHPQRTSFIQDEAGLAAPVFRDILVSTAP
ncbi:MAG: sialate O-acetylesterase, partial [Myxococcota bacterium]